MRTQRCAPEYLLCGNCRSDPCLVSRELSQWLLWAHRPSKDKIRNQKKQKSRLIHPKMSHEYIPHSGRNYTIILWTRTFLEFFSPKWKTVAGVDWWGWQGGRPISPDLLLCILPVITVGKQRTFGIGYPKCCSMAPCPWEASDFLYTSSIWPLEYSTSYMKDRS